MPRLPDFLPETPPIEIITDFSNTLSPATVADLTATAKAYSYKPTVIILPGDYDSPDSTQLAMDCASKWGMDAAGRNLLVVVDLKKHIVRVHGSSDLNDSGITSSYITNSLVPNKFVPLMKRDNLGGAVKSTLTAVDTKLKYQQQESHTVASQRIDPVMFTNPNHSPSVAKFEIIGFFCLLSAVVIYLLSKMMEPVKNGPRDPVIQQAYDDQTNGVSWNPKTQSYNTDRWVNGVRNRSGNSVSDSSDGSSFGSSDSGSSGSSDGGGSW